MPNMIRFFITILSLIFACSLAKGQIDPHLNLTVSSGSDAIFNINRIQDFTSTKELPYYIVLKLEYSGAITKGKYFLHAKMLSDNFDGPSHNMKSGIIGVKVVGYRCETLKTGEYGNNNERAPIGESADYKYLTTSESDPLIIITTLPSKQSVQDIRYNCFYITLKICIKPTDENPLLGLMSGFYSNYLCFTVKTAN